MNELERQGQELGNKTLGSFMKETQGKLSFWDGIKWQGIASARHLEQMGDALEIYLDKQLEHVEYTTALAMSERRANLFEQYQTAINQVSDRVRDQMISYRDATKNKVMDAAGNFFSTMMDEDAKIDARGLPAEYAQKLKEANHKLANQNFQDLMDTLEVEFSHYTEMTQRIYVGMNDEIQRQFKVING